MAWLHHELGIQELKARGARILRLVCHFRLQQGKVRRWEVFGRGSVIRDAMKL